jgi:hypothetical protein
MAGARGQLDMDAVPFWGIFGRYRTQNGWALKECGNSPKYEVITLLHNYTSVSTSMALCIGCPNRDELLKNGLD